MTVLQALDRQYDRMAAAGEAEPPGRSREPISFAIVLSRDGRAVDVIDLRVMRGRKLAAPRLSVPAAVRRTVSISPNRFWDKSAYVLGRTAGPGRRAAGEHAAFKRAHASLLRDTDDAGLAALGLFLTRWTPSQFDRPPFTSEMLDTNIVFKLESEAGYLHDSEAVSGLLEPREGGDQDLDPCLVTGLLAPVARLHPVIKGVVGAPATGAALVSFNLDASESYGKAQGANAPTSDAAAFRYGASLNRMLERGSRNRLSRVVGDATLVFWADTSDTVSEGQARGAEHLFALLIEPLEDEVEAAKLSKLIDGITRGDPLRDLDWEPALVGETRFHVLGLAPNTSRLFARCWVEEQFGRLAFHLAQHHADLTVLPDPWGRKRPSLQWLLAMTAAPRQTFDDIPSGLAGEVLRAVLTGAPYPRTWLVAVLNSLRAGGDPDRGWHAGVIKACLNRAHRLSQCDAEEILPMSLDPENPSEAYQLGRLFAVLESAHYAALGRVPVTLADRWYGLASSTPARVFPALIRGAKTHLRAARRRGQGFWIEPRMQEIVARLPPELPVSLRIEDQGRFAVGYYHERAYRGGGGHVAGGQVESMEST